VNVNASVTRGRYLFTHTSAKQGAESATYAAGAFGRILKSGTSPSCVLYSATAQTSGAGAISGSTGSTDNAVLRADGTGGATLQASLATVDDSGGINIPTGQTYNIDGSPHTHAGSGPVGWSPFVAHYAYNHNATINTNITTLAVVSGGVGGAIASPIWVPTYAKLDTLTIRNNDSSATRTAEFRLYLDSGNDSNTLNEVPNSAGTFSFTGTGSANKSAAFTSAPVTVAPGLYWLVIRNTSEAQTFLLQAQSTGTMLINGYQLKSLPALGSTLDFVASTWTKSNNILAAVISCRIFGQTTAY
jgi:hypothetical protein